MSKDYRTAQNIKMADLFDGRMEKYGITEELDSPRTSKSRCLRHGENSLWVNADATGGVSELTSYSTNDPTNILHAVAQKFDTEIWTEDEPQFWGFATQGEMDRWHMDGAKAEQGEFYQNIRLYVATGTHSYQQGSPGQVDIKIAKELIDRNPELIYPENKEKLFEGINGEIMNRYKEEMKPSEEEQARIYAWYKKALENNGFRLPEPDKKADEWPF
jgi:hypothetical protein